MEVLDVEAEWEMIIFPDSGTQLLTKGMGKVYKCYQAQRNIQRKEGGDFVSCSVLMRERYPVPFAIGESKPTKNQLSK